MRNAELFSNAECGIMDAIAKDLIRLLDEQELIANENVGR